MRRGVSSEMLPGNTVHSDCDVRILVYECVYMFLFQKDEAGRRVFLTQGSWDVTEIVSVDNNYVYFLGTGGNATKRHLYRFVIISLLKSRYKM